MKKDVLGVKIDDISLDEAQGLVITWLKKGGKHYIVTPNPEFVMAAQNDPVFREILNKADLAIPDGIGLKMANPDLQNRVTGVDLMVKIIEYCSANGFTIGLLGGEENAAKILKERLLEKYPNLKITFTDSGGEINNNGEQISQYPEIHTDILFVAFGQVKQEKWIANNLNKSSVKIMMGVGGAFDYLSGKVKRAPKIIRNLGLEWLFRLAMQPKRLLRYPALFAYFLKCILK